MTNFEIEYWDDEDNLLTFYVSVTNYVNVAPQGKWADSDWDCYGYEEVEWVCDCVTITDTDGNCVVKAVDISQYSDYIEGKLLEQIRESKDDDFDYPEPLDYYDGY